MEINSIKTGDILLVNGRNNGKQTFLSKSICWFMKVFAKKNKIVYDWIASHAATFIWIDDTLYVSESVDNGYHLREFDKHYSFDTDDYCVLEPIVPYTEEETKLLKRVAINLQTVSLFYNYPAVFIQFPLYILFGINLFGKGNRGILYCYRSTEMVSETIRPNDWNKDNKFTDFFDIYDNPTLRLKISNKL